MTVDPEDRLLDLGLSEVLGGQAPPDQTDKILARLAAEQATEPSTQQVPQQDGKWLSIHTRGWLIGAAAAALVLLSVRAFLIPSAPVLNTVAVVLQQGELHCRLGQTTVELPKQQPHWLRLSPGDRFTAGARGALCQFRAFGSLWLNPLSIVEIQSMEDSKFWPGVGLGAMTVAVIGGGILWSTGTFSKSAEAGESQRMERIENLNELPADRAALHQRITDLEQKLQAEQSRYAELAANAGRTAVESPGGAVAEAAPKIESKAQPARFLHFGLEEVLATINWDASGTAIHAMVPAILEMIRITEETGDLPLDLIGEVQSHNGELIKQAALLTNAKVPGSDINGAYTHPVVTANLVYSALDKMGKGMTTEQQDAMAALSSRVSSDFDQRLAEAGDSALTLESVLMEVDLKERYLEQARQILTPEQVQAVMPSASRDLIGTDLFSPGLVLAQYLSPVEARDRASFSQSVTNDYVSRLNLSGEDAAKVQQFVAEYAGAIPDEAWNSLTTKKRSPFLSAHAVRQAAGKQLELTQRILREINLPKDRKDHLMKSKRVILPTHAR